MKDRENSPSSKWWIFVLCLITILVIGAATHLYFKMESEKLSTLGDYVSAAAATLAFLWLVGGYFLQNKELAAQREELRLQREAMLLQKEEMHRTSKFAAYQQIAALVREFRSSYSLVSVREVTNDNECGECLAYGLHTVIPRILEAEDAKEIKKWYSTWSGIKHLHYGLFDLLRVVFEIYTEAIGKPKTFTDDQFMEFLNSVEYKELNYRIPFADSLFKIGYLVVNKFYCLEALRHPGGNSEKVTMSKKIRWAEEIGGAVLGLGATLECDINTNKIKNYYGDGECSALFYNDELFAIQYLRPAKSEDRPNWVKAIMNTCTIGEDGMPVANSSAEFTALAQAASNADDCPVLSDGKRYRPADLLRMAKAYIGEETHPTRIDKIISGSGLSCTVHAGRIEGGKFKNH